jgi:hypothetical protein
VTKLKYNPMFPLCSGGGVRWEPEKLIQSTEVNVISKQDLAPDQFVDERINTNVDGCPICSAYGCTSLVSDVCSNLSIRG